jgi:ribosomal protein L32E
VKSVRWRRHVISMTFKNKPRGQEALVRIYAQTNDRAFPILVRAFRVASDRLRARVSGTLTQVSITYRDPQRVREPSVLLDLHFVR